MVYKNLTMLISLLIFGCNPLIDNVTSVDPNTSRIKCTITSKTGNGCTVWRYTQWCNEVEKDQLPIDTLFLSPEHCSLKK